MINHHRANRTNGNNPNINGAYKLSSPSSSSIELSPMTKIDPLDIKIMSLMISGLVNKQIAVRLRVPLSTVQRRTRRLIEKGMISMKAELNLQMMGFKRGMIHVYINGGNIDQIARKISVLDPIESVEVHIGNSDMVGNMIYRNSKELLKTISDVKKIEGVNRIVWSERIYNIANNDNRIANLLNFYS